MLKVYYKRDKDKIDIPLSQGFSHKRYQYNTILKFYKEYLRGNSLNHTLAITGLRRIGKTTILLQLYNELSDVCYMDCSGSETADDIEQVLIDIKNHGIKVCLIDEICKLNSNMFHGKEIFSSLMKIWYTDIFFIFTGSVSLVVEDIASQICDCYMIKMPPITYLEELYWENEGCSETDLLAKSTMKSLYTYLTCNNFFTRDHVMYLRGIFNDYSETVYGKELEQLRDNNKISLLLDYIRCSNTIHRAIGTVNKKLIPKKFNDLQPFVLLDRFSDEDRKYIKSIHRKINAVKDSVKAEDLSMLCDFLVNVGLIKQAKYYTSQGKNSTRNDVKIEDTYIPFYIPIAPQLIYDEFKINTKGKLINGKLKAEYIKSITVSYMDSWIENILYSAMSDIYFNSGFYRSAKGDSEVDILYKIEDYDRYEDNTNYFVEVKNKTYKNMYKDMNKYDKLSIESIKEFVITNSDVRFRKIDGHKVQYVMRNDILLLLLQMEYFRIQENELLTSNNSVIDLYRMYSKEGDRV